MAGELLKPAKKRFPRRKIYSPGVDSIWAADLLDIKKYAKQNKNCQYILVIVDLFSKKAWARGMKNKTGISTANAFKDVFKDGEKPRKIWVDRGKEFYNKNLKDLLKKNDIEIYSTYNEPKSACAERFIRSLRRLISNNFVLTNSTTWYNVLPKLIDEYNNRIHRSIYSIV